MKKTLLAAALIAAPLTANAGFMDADWAAMACDAWNANATLTNELGGDWAGNNGGRGYKLILYYRGSDSDGAAPCGQASRVQMTIEDQGGKAICTYGGAPDAKAAVFDKSMDYEMHASDKNWAKMGTGETGAMGAMMWGKLKFNGPKMEAMSVMGPFNAYLQLVDDVREDAATITAGTCN